MRQADDVGRLRDKSIELLNAFAQGFILERFVFFGEFSAGKPAHDDESGFGLRGKRDEFGKRVGDEQIKWCLDGFIAANFDGMHTFGYAAGHADVQHFARLACVLHGGECVAFVEDFDGCRVDLNQVDVVGLQFAQAAVDEAQSGFVGVVKFAAVGVAVFAHFGGQGVFVAAGFEAVADELFAVPIGGCGVDKVHACVEGFVQETRRLVAGKMGGVGVYVGGPVAPDFKCAEADLRYGDAGVAK